MAAGSVERLMPFFAIFIGVWWSFGLIFTTFSLSAPFTTCANLNGFLAVWTAFVASWYLPSAHQCGSDTLWPDGEWTGYVREWWMCGRIDR